MDQYVVPSACYVDPREEDNVDNVEEKVNVADTLGVEEERVLEIQ